MIDVSAFVRLSRPKFLLGGVAGFALGVAVARYEGIAVTAGWYAAGQAMVTAFHLMTHYANDYFDRDSDRHTQPSEFAGGSGVLVAGSLRPSVALRAALFCAGAGVLLCAALAVCGRQLSAVVGIAIGVLAWSYSAPPLRLAASGTGEASTALVVGILVPLAGYVTFAGAVNSLALAATLGPACAMFAMMIGVEFPDRAGDTLAAKRNLIVRFGPRVAGRLGAGAALLIVPSMLVAIGYGAPPTSAIFGLLLVPLVGAFIARVRGSTPSGDVAALGVTLFLVTVFFELLGYVAAGRGLLP